MLNSPITVMSVEASFLSNTSKLEHFLIMCLSNHSIIPSREHFLLCEKKKNQTENKNIISSENSGHSGVIWIYIFCKINS